MVSERIEIYVISVSSTRKRLLIYLFSHLRDLTTTDIEEYRWTDFVLLKRFVFERERVGDNMFVCV